MATTTPNFGWDIPQSTDLVKDGATAIAALGTDIDTALVDLKGGTTGQVLSKNSNTDLDFTWVAQDDSNAIQNAIVDAKGDLISATAADTPARLAVGTNGQVLTADSTQSTGLAWTTISAGGMTLISTTTLSGASVTLSSIPQTYNNLQLVIRNFRPVTDGDNLYMRFNGVTGNNYNGQNFTSTAVLDFDRDYIALINAVDNTAADGLSCVNIWDYTNTATWKFATIFSFANNATTATSLSQRNATGWHNNTAAISSITLYCPAGNFTSGTALLYGVK